MSAAKISLKGYNGGMVLRRTPHAVYDTLYHLVWSPKYRRDVLQGEVQERVRELFVDIAEQYDITIERRFPRSEMLQQSGMRLRSFCPENRMTCDGRVDRFILPRG